ncbi:ORF6N domain-containing protein [Fibrobacterota bacterium]
MKKSLTTTEIKNLIYNIRGKAVMLDSDLARLYQVETRILNQAVRRNIDRFPEDFMFELTKGEFENLISQIVTSSSHGGRRKLPLVFTEQGVAMLSSVLKSKIAIHSNIHIMRAFVQVRRLGMTVVDLKRKLDGMERKYDNQFKVVFNAIRQLSAPPPEKKKGEMGFTKDK